MILMRCTKRSHLDPTWDVCRARGSQGLGYMCEFVSDITEDSMTRNIRNSMGVQ